MIEIKGSVVSLVDKSRRFLRHAQYCHIVLAVCMLATGVVAVILSDGSNGTAKVPYFFSAFITGVWHIVFIVLCRVCMYYLSGDVSDGNRATALVRAYSISSSVFVLFNVMGVVFTVVNGICIESMMCYYDKNHISNRIMAILLILEHCLSILISVFLAKRSHVIDSELSSDIAIRLNQNYDFLKIRTKKHSRSHQQTDTPRSEQTTSSRDDNMDQSALTEVHSKGGHVLTTIEISAMTHRKTHRRSKSQPLMLKQLGLKPPEMEGEVFSIYSDSETKSNEKERKKKRRFIPHRRGKSNRVTTVEISVNKHAETDSNFSEDTSLSSYGTRRTSVDERIQKLNQLESVRKNVAPLTAVGAESDEFLHVKPVSGTENAHAQKEILERQEEIQRRQEKLLAEQLKLFQAQQKQVESKNEQSQPPPYTRNSGSQNQTDTGNSRTSLQDSRSSSIDNSYEQEQKSRAGSGSSESLQSASALRGTNFQGGRVVAPDSEC